MRYILLALLVISCANRKKTIRTYVDEIINERISVDNHIVSNNNINDNMTISFRVNEYDTNGRMIKETIADVQKVKTEENHDILLQEIDEKREVDRDIKAELKEEKKHSISYFWFGVCFGLIFVIAIYIAIKFRK